MAKKHPRTTASASYDEAKPKQFGNLHERMKFLIEVASARQPEVPTDAWHAIFDLETEVRGYRAIEPPFGRRPVPTSRRS
jgi:hypothetical protein